jgi:hypothetical protein
MIPIVVKLPDEYQPGRAKITQHGMKPYPLTITDPLERGFGHMRAVAPRCPAPGQQKHGQPYDTDGEYD